MDFLLWSCVAWGTRMFFEHKELLNQAEVARLVARSQTLRFVDGRLSNPANVTKSNLHADLAEPGYAESAQSVMTAVDVSREFRDFARPRKIAAPLLSRYEPSMKYGAHADT